MAPRPSAHLFCSVIDHFGDASIAWQLATGLACDNGFDVTLFIDQKDTLKKLDPDCEKKQHITVQALPLHTIPLSTHAPDMVIEILSGSAPVPYIKAIAKADAPPLWVIYEYLSAEPWTKTCHLSPSPHPEFPLMRYFFYPGFEPETGGLLFRPSCLVSPDQSLKENFIPLQISLFCYKNQQIIPLLDVFTENKNEILLSVPDGDITNSVNQFLEVGGKTRQKTTAIGSLSVEFKPFMPRSNFETYLSMHHINFVRGEESLTSAVLSGLPFVWHIYPQDDGAHLGKLDAFCALYTDGLANGPARAFSEMNRAWNDQTRCIKSAWKNYGAHWAEIAIHADQFARRMQKQGSALKNLVDFYYKR